MSNLMGLNWLVVSAAPFQFECFVRSDSGNRQELNGLPVAHSDVVHHDARVPNVARGLNLNGATPGRWAAHGANVLGR